MTLQKRHVYRLACTRCKARTRWSNRSATKTRAVATADGWQADEGRPALCPDCVAKKDAA